jgi:methionine synthase / methylenetetrahydrofolate reductase(NADPH)
MHPFLARLRSGPLLVDGAMGTMLHARGAALNQCLEALNLTHPDWVRELHLAYLAAGADIIQANTFGGARPRLAEVGLGEQTREINLRGIKLAREAREIHGQPAFVAGSIGPLGRAARGEDGVLKVESAQKAFREQAEALWEGGADLLILETFSYLPELLLALEVIRQSTDLPLVAEMTFGEEGVVVSGENPESVAQALQQAGAGVVGVNCSLGPAKVLEVVSAMHRGSPELALSALPNAGFPFRSGERMIYPSAPAYFATHVAAFLDNGAQLVGGCCGTTPAHTRAMRIALDAALSITRETPGAAQPAIPVLRAPAPWGEEPANEPEPTPLLTKLRQGKFVVSVEVDPPRGFSPEKTLAGARIARQYGADAVNVADSPMARVRMSALALCTLIQTTVGIETMLHFTTRDRSLMGLQADLIGAHALGIRNILALTGDPPTLGDHPESHPVYDVDSIGLVRIMQAFNRGEDRTGGSFGSRSGFTVAVACDPTRPDIEVETDRLARKLAEGAHLIMTQPVFASEVWLRFVDLFAQRHGPLSVPVLIGILPLQSHRHATFLHNEVPGISIPEATLDRMAAAGNDGRRAGVQMAQELLLELRNLPGVQGVYLMPSFGRYEVACEVLEVL